MGTQLMEDLSYQFVADEQCGEEQKKDSVVTTRARYLPRDKECPQRWDLRPPNQSRTIHSLSDGHQDCGEVLLLLAPPAGERGEESPGLFLISVLSFLARLLLTSLLVFQSKE